VFVAAAAVVVVVVVVVVAAHMIFSGPPRLYYILHHLPRALGEPAPRPPRASRASHAARRHAAVEGEVHFLGRRLAAHLARARLTRQIAPIMSFLIRLQGEYDGRVHVEIDAAMFSMPKEGSRRAWSVTPKEESFRERVESLLLQVVARRLSERDNREREVSLSAPGGRDGGRDDDDYFGR